MLCPFQKLKRFLAKGLAPIPGEGWRALAAGAAWLRGSAVLRYPLITQPCSL